MYLCWYSQDILHEIQGWFIFWRKPSQRSSVRGLPQRLRTEPSGSNATRQVGAFLGEGDISRRRRVWRYSITTEVRNDERGDVNLAGEKGVPWDLTMLGTVIDIRYAAHPKPSLLPASSIWSTGFHLVVKEVCRVTKWLCVLFILRHSFYRDHVWANKISESYATILFSRDFALATYAFLCIPKSWIVGFAMGVHLIISFVFPNLRCMLHFMSSWRRGRMKRYRCVRFFSHSWMAQTVITLYNPLYLCIGWWCKKKRFLISGALYFHFMYTTGKMLSALGAHFHNGKLSWRKCKEVKHAKFGRTKLKVFSFFVTATGKIERTHTRTNVM